MFSFGKMLPTNHLCLFLFRCVNRQQDVQVRVIVFLRRQFLGKVLAYDLELTADVNSDDILVLDLAEKEFP